MKKLYISNKESTVGYFESTLKEDIKTFIYNLRYFKGVRTILDIGCNIGTFMDVAKFASFNIEGVDINTLALEHCKAKGHQVYSSWPKKKYDALHCAEVIEHFEDPYNQLLQMGRCLKTGGMLFITTPNTNSLLRHLMQSHWPLWKPKEHLFFFDPISIKILLEHTGFQVISIKRSIRYRSMSTVIIRVLEIFGINFNITGKYTLSFIIPFEGGMQVIARKR